MDLFVFSITFEIISSIWSITFNKSFFNKTKNRNWRLTECEMLPWKRLDKYELANQSYLFWWFKKILKCFFLNNCFHSTKRESRKSHFSILVKDHCMELNYIPIVCASETLFMSPLWYIQECITSLISSQQKIFLYICYSKDKINDSLL